MKGLTPVLLLSLAANAALAALVYSRRLPADVVSADPTEAQVTATRSAATGQAGAATATPAVPGAAQPRPDDVAFVARLRASGLPADVIRDLLYLRIQERYRERRRALLPDDVNEYWRSWNQTGIAAASPETRAKLRDLGREVEAEVRALLGAGPESLGAYQRRLYDQLEGSVPNAKIQQIEAIQRDYDEMAANVRAKGKGLVLKADREQLRLLERERRADLAAALAPEELLEYDLRASSTSEALRNRLAYFEPTEGEFRSLAKLQLELDQRFGTSNLSGEEQERRRAAEKDLATQIRTVLQPDRYNDYLVTIDGMFSETRSFTNTNNLDPSAAKEIVALKQSTWKRVDALDQAGVTGDQRTAALTALQQEVDRQLTARLGSEIFAKYKRGEPTWMNRLRPNPPRS